jgi:hypothetical protein
MMLLGLRVIVLLVLVLGELFSLRQPAHAIPAFARKYSLPCSACHEAWPKLNDFGIAFRDRGYQLGNEKDSPIWQNPSYWPITMRITPQWHRESSSNQLVDAVPGNAALGQTFQNVTTHGFDFGGVDIYSERSQRASCSEGEMVHTNLVSDGLDALRAYD